MNIPPPLLGLSYLQEMELHSLLGQQPGSSAIEAVVREAAKKASKSSMNCLSPTIKVFKDAVYYSYFALGISFNFEPSEPLDPSAYSTGKDGGGTVLPDSSVLSLAAIHVYKNPTDQFETFPLAFSVLCSSRTIVKEKEEMVTMRIEMDVNKRAHEVVSLLGEPESKVGGGRQGNCWIGYLKSTGLSVDFAGSNWEDRKMPVATMTLTYPCQ